MIPIKDFLRDNGSSLSKCWGREFWHCTGAFSTFSLGLEHLRSDFEKGELTNFAAFRDGTRLDDCKWGSATILIRAIERYFLWIETMGRKLEAYLGAEYSDTSLVFSPATVSGPPVHRDPYNLLVFQLSGSKRWRLWDKDHKQMPEQMLHEGDVFHVPAGRLHTAIPCAESLHLAAKFPAKIT